MWPADRVVAGCLVGVCTGCVGGSRFIFTYLLVVLIVLCVACCMYVQRGPSCSVGSFCAGLMIKGCLEGTYMMPAALIGHLWHLLDGIFLRM
jgi:hypothetical protein